MPLTDAPLRVPAKVQLFPSLAPVRIAVTELPERVTVMVAVVILASRDEFAASIGLFTPFLFTVSKSLAR